MVITTLEILGPRPRSIRVRCGEHPTHAIEKSSAIYKDSYSGHSEDEISLNIHMIGDNWMLMKANR